MRLRHHHAASFLDNCLKKDMRTLLAVLALCLGLMVQGVSPRLDALVSRGNRAYLLGQRDVILDCARQLDSLIGVECKTRADSADYMFSLYKLYGNYHYENATLDPASLAEAERYYALARQTEGARFSQGHLIDLELAQLYYRDGRYQAALECVDNALLYIDENSLLEPGDTEWNNYEMQRAICLARLGRTDEAISLADNTLKDYRDRRSLDYARAQRVKAKILMLAARRPGEAVKAYKEFFRTQRRFVKENFTDMDSHQREQYWLGLRPFVADCYTLEGLDPEFLYDVTLFSKGLLLHVSRTVGSGRASIDRLKSLDYTWRDVSRKLKPGQAAAEFIQYEKDDTTRMAVLLLRHKSRPKFIPIGNPSDFERLAGKAFRLTNQKGKNRLYTNDELAATVLTPELRAELQGVTRLYFAPDGFLYKYAIEYTPLAQSLDMHRLTSTRVLVGPRRPQPLTSTLFCGGIDYARSDGDDSEAANDSLAYATFQRTAFQQLRPETNEARILYEQLGAKADTLLTGEQSTEALFRRVAPDYTNIIVSTHGLFRSHTVGIGTDLKPSLTDETMSHGIVAFAGATSMLRRDDFDPSRHCDGILSALELSALDLSRCDLFTLSACQTGLGEITCDGVFGLQRGLKNAGVGAMLVSLWDVNSVTTSLLMQTLYARLAAGVPIHQAFTEARSALIGHEPENYNLPQFTHPFLLIDAIE